MKMIEFECEIITQMFLARANDRIPLYAATKRVARGESVNGFIKMTHYFKHIMFRRYIRQE